MKTLYARLIILGILFGIAGIAGAYTPPTSGAFGANTDGPLTIGANNQDKEGGLWVKTFQARGNAYFNLETYVQGDITGKEINGDGTSTVLLGGETVDGKQYTVSAGINGAVNVSGLIQSDSLATGPGGGKKPVCADVNGTFFLCNTATPPSTASTLSTTSATLNFYVDGSNQTGSYVMVQSNNDGAIHIMELSPGTNTGTSFSQTLQAGTYTLVQTDVTCALTGTAPVSPTPGDQIFLSDGDFYTLNFLCL